MERRLAAIFAADVVGYSRLIRADEEGTLAAFQALRSDLIDPGIAAHNGRIVKEMGDGLLVEFSSVVDAVRGAVGFQQAMAGHNGELPEDRRIVLRIGLNLGDVVIEGDDIHGDGVNVAARLEGLAEPGGICISDSVYEQVRDRVDLRFQDMGEQTVRNIDRPVHAWRWLADGAAGSVSPDGGAKPKVLALPVPDKPTIAVLPFENMSGDSEQEYFSDGISEDIINALASWRSFPVIARNSSFAYKGHASDVRVIAAELGARYVLEGSVRRTTERVRVTARLIDADSGHQLWADRFDRAIREIFELQDEIVESIVAATAPELLRAEERRANRKRPSDLSAWDFILRAISAKAIGHGYGTKEGNDTARQYLDRAIALEDSAEAWAWRALCEWHDAINGWVEDTDGALDRCIGAARKSVDEDDANWLAHSVLGIALLFGRGQAEAAVGEAVQGVTLNPSSSAARHILGCALDFSGYQVEAIPHLEAVFRLDPRYRIRAAAYADLSLSKMLLGEYEAAVSWAEKTVAADPDYIRGRQRLVAAFSAAGRADEARAELSEVLRRQPGFSLDYVKRTYPFADPGQAAKFAGWLSAAGVV